MTNTAFAIPGNLNASAIHTGPALNAAPGMPQLADSPGNNLFGLFLAGLFQSGGQAPVTGPALTNQGGNSLPDGKGLPFPAGIADADEFSDVVVTTPAVTPASSWLNRLHAVAGVEIPGDPSFTSSATIGPSATSRTDKTDNTRLQFILLKQLGATKQPLPLSGQEDPAPMPLDDLLSNTHKLKPSPMPDGAAGQFLLNRLSAGGEVNIPDNQMPPATLDRIAITDLKLADHPSRAGSPDTPGLLKLAIDAPLQHPQWGQSLAGRITMMILNNQHTAQININPPELGPIEVKVSINHDHQASVNFIAHHGEVRDAIEEAFPRLRELLSHNGLTLGESNVSAHTFNHGQDARPEVFDEVPGMSATIDSEPDATGDTTVKHLSIGLIDHYV